MWKRYLFDNRPCCAFSRALDRVHTATPAFFSIPHLPDLNSRSLPSHTPHTNHSKGHTTTTPNTRPQYSVRSTTCIYPPCATQQSDPSSSSRRRRLLLSQQLALVRTCVRSRALIKRLHITYLDLLTCLSTLPLYPPLSNTPNSHLLSLLLHSYRPLGPGPL